MDGAGYARVINDQPAAVVGSSLSNGDRIVETSWGHLEQGIFIRRGQGAIGLFDPDWILPLTDGAKRVALYLGHGER